jgi:hypothetical protein
MANGTWELVHPQKKKKKKNLIACRGLGRVVGPLLELRVHCTRRQRTPPTRASERPGSGCGLGLARPLPSLLFCSNKGTGGIASLPRAFPTSSLVQANPPLGTASKVNFSLGNWLIVATNLASSTSAWHRLNEQGWVGRRLPTSHS